MWARGVLLMSVVATVYGLAIPPSTRPKYIGCLTSDECGRDACCVIGMGRFSIPNCQSRRDMGEQCRPLGEPINATLSYPDNATVELVGVYHITCPCLGGLECGEHSMCVDNNIISNHIDYSEENNFHY